MAAVLDQKEAAAKNSSQVDEQIAQATSRIRAHDLAFGGLVLLALMLVYTTAMIVLDRYLNLPEWVRQVALFGFVALTAATAYVTVLSPLRKRINPLYAAKQVERTIDDPKNSVTGYVDAQQKGDLNATVKAALASRAAKAALEADVNRAVDHRSLMYLGGVSVAFVLALVVLFFVFRPAQFSSLVGRTFVPFSSDPIASRTQLTVTKPDPVEPTITTGQSITVAVYVGGKVPAPNGPDKVRLLVRHNPADPNYDELPMVPAQGATNRDWELRVPDYLVQNGFWYKVAAGDAVTPEYKVFVRSLPRFTDTFQTTYEYPKYLRRKSETNFDPVVKAYRGTTVTLVAKANRDVRDGLMVIEPSNTRVAGTPVAGKPDTLQFVFKVTESGKYKLTFTATNGERSADPFQANVTAEGDAAPIVTINKPEEDETAEPANGQFKVDGKVGDDFGVDTVTLKMRIVAPAERPLPDAPFMNGKTASFRRETDDTWPTDLEYKGSVDLAKLKKDAAGLPLALSPETVIEYWLEASDNCTEPRPNVGRSAPKRVRLTAPKAEEPDQKQLDKQKDARRDEEKKHTDQQQQKFNNEKREPKRDQRPREDKGNTGEKQPDAQPDPKQPGDKGEATPKNSNEPPKKGGSDPKMGDPAEPPKGPAEGQPMNPMGPGMPPPEAPMPNTPDQKNIDETAKDFKQELDKQNKDGGGAKPNPEPKEADRTDPGSAKQPPTGPDGKDNSVAAKPEPKEPNPADPMNPGAAGASKPQGDVKKPDDPTAPKPEPKKDTPMPGTGGPQNGAPSEPRDEPFGAPPGTDKPEPKELPPAPKDPNQKHDPKSGASAKPASKKDGDGSGAANASEKKDPAANAGNRKPSPETTRGGDKPPADPKDPPSADTKPQGGDPDAGDAKPSAAPRAGDAKPMPKNDPTAKGTATEPKPAEGANEPMKPNATGAAETKPDAPKNPPMTGGKPVDKGTDKPQPNDAKPGAGGAPGGGGDAPKQKLDEKQLKELQDAAKDLTNPEPKKKQDARDKLDRAIGEEKRKELEKLANDANSPDAKTREDALRKLDDMKKQMEGGAGGKEPDNKGDAPKFDPKRAKDIENAANNLTDPDPKKQQEGRDKLDKLIGEESRKELEKTLKDLNSDDKTKQAAAREKIEKWKKEAQEQNKGRELTPEEIAADKERAKEVGEALKDLRGNDPAKKEAARQKLDKLIGRDTRERAEDLFKDLDSTDPEKQKRGEDKLEAWRKESDLKDLAKKAQDLQSKDPKTREQAEKDLDDKIGKANREKLQKDLENKKLGPKDIEDLKKEMDEWRQALGRGTPAKGPMDDATKDIKNSEFQLEQFENEANRKALQAKKGWTDAEYDRFLDGYRKRIEQMREDAKKGATDKPPVAGPTELATPLKAGGGGKVDGLPGSTGGPAGVGGPASAAPGFEDARQKFLDALKKKP